VRRSLFAAAGAGRVHQAQGSALAAARARDIHVTKDALRQGGDARGASEAVGLVGFEPACPLDARQRAARDDGG